MNSGHSFLEQPLEISPSSYVTEIIFLVCVFWAKSSLKSYLFPL